MYFYKYKLCIIAIITKSSSGKKYNSYIIKYILQKCNLF